MEDEHTTGIRRKRDLVRMRRPGMEEEPGEQETGTDHDPPTAPDNPDTRKSKQGVRKIDTVKEYGQNEIPNVKSNIHCLPIIGQIEGHLVLPPQNKTTKYEHVIPQLVAVEQNPEIEGLLIVLNTVGGDVEVGLAIAEMIVSMSKPTVSLILGAATRSVSR